MTTQSVQQEDSFGAGVGSELGGSQSWGLGRKGKLPGETQKTRPQAESLDQERRAAQVDLQGWVAGWTLGLKEKWESMTAPSLGPGEH